jgi:hypothetical protein
MQTMVDSIYPIQVSRRIPSDASSSTNCISQPNTLPPSCRCIARCGYPTRRLARLRPPRTPQTHPGWLPGHSPPQWPAEHPPAASQEKRNSGSSSMLLSGFVCCAYAQPSTPLLILRKSRQLQLRCVPRKWSQAPSATSPGMLKLTILLFRLFFFFFEWSPS